MKNPLKILLVFVFIFAISNSLFSIEPTTFAVIGDFGSGDSNETAVANLVKSWNPQFVVTTGDDRYGTTNFDLTVGRDYCNFIAGAQSGINCDGNRSSMNSFFPSTGNHEYTDGGGINEYLAYFDLPGAGVQSSGTSGSEKYYDFIQGPIHFFVIDSYDATVNGTLDVQKIWLQNQMTASTSIWKIVYFHHPPYSSSSSHGSTVAMRWPFAEWGADAVLNGHDHTYERLHLDNVAYFVNGLGGKSKYGFSTPIPESAIQYNAEYGAQKVVADDISMTFSFINVLGVTVDTYTIYKTNPPLVNITSPLSNSHFISPKTISVSAEASDTDGTIAEVEFFVNGTSVATDNVSPYSINWIIPENGAYSITAKATDNLGAITFSTPVDITVGEFNKTVVSQISSGSDDVEESSAGTMYLTSTDLELVYDDYQTAGNQTVGLRFTQLGIPQGAFISNSYIQFTADEAVNRDGSLVLSGHSIDDSPAFTSSTYNVSSRIKTSSSVSWNPPPWNTTDVADPEQQTPDLSSVIQEIVNRPGFSQSSAISLIINGTGTRTAEAYEGVASAAPVLHVEYSNVVFVSNFTYEVNDLEVSFSDLSNGTIASWDWDFGDGGIATVQNPTHTYETDGIYNVALIITNNEGTFATYSQVITVCNDTDNDGVCDSGDECPNDPNKTTPGDCGCGNVETDTDNDGIADCIDDCIAETIAFPDNPLTHSGSGSNSTSINLPENSKDISFTISDINEKAKPSSKNYMELVTVSYINGVGNEIEYGSLSAYIGNIFVIDIPGEVQSVSIRLEDGGDGNSGSSVMSILIGQIEYCIGEVDICTDSDSDGVCDNDDGCPDDPNKSAPGDCGCGEVEIDINNDGISDCLQSPDPPVADFTASSLSVLVGEMVDFTDISSNNPTSWYWQFGDGQTSNLQYPQINYNLPDIYTVSLEATNQFGTGSVTKTITVSPIPNSDYCEPANIDYTSDYIFSVVVDGVEYANDENSNGYNLFSTSGLSFESGGNYLFTLQPFDSKNRNFWRIWIDSNGDGDFDDINETLYIGNNKKGTVSENISIPADINISNTRLRISMKTGSSPSSCDDNFSGEVEDYVISITAAAESTFAKKSASIQDNSLNTIEENKEVSVIVFPNPATDKLIVRFNGWDGEKEIKLIDLTGRSVFLMKSVKEINEIDISSFPKGIYIINAKNEFHGVTKKIKIQ